MMKPTIFGVSSDIRGYLMVPMLVRYARINQNGTCELKDVIGCRDDIMVC